MNPPGDVAHAGGWIPTAPVVAGAGAPGNPERNVASGFGAQVVPIAPQSFCSFVRNSRGRDCCRLRALTPTPPTSSNVACLATNARPGRPSAPHSRPAWRSKSGRTTLPAPQPWSSGTDSGPASLPFRLALVSHQDVRAVQQRIGARLTPGHRAEHSAESRLIFEAATADQKSTPKYSMARKPQRIVTSGMKG